MAPTRTWRCSCGAELARYRGQGDQTCPGCGAEYNAFGQRLAPRCFWGEETGETLADIYGPDPERLPGEEVF